MKFISYSSLICTFFSLLMSLMSSCSIVKQSIYSIILNFIQQENECLYCSNSHVPDFMENEFHICFLTLYQFLLVYLLISCLLPIPPLLIMELVRGIGKRSYPEKHYQDYFRKKGELQQQVFKLNVTSILCLFVLFIIVFTLFTVFQVLC